MAQDHLGVSQSRNVGFGIANVVNAMLVLKYDRQVETITVQVMGDVYVLTKLEIPCCLPGLVFKDVVTDLAGVAQVIVVHYFSKALEIL